uniref:ATP synthase F0 subunit 8 n=1 Tax=Hiatella arctica TaxID=120431 RepID=Q06SB7_9BIVA|nr:ATP synthase F0 subunit 8 [Hiatella arctica]
MPLVMPMAYVLMFLAFNWVILSLIVYFWWASKRPYDFMNLSAYNFSSSSILKS